MTDPGAAIEGAVDAAVEPHTNGGAPTRAQADDVERTFSGEPPGLVGVWALGDFKAELKFLTQPDTGDPLDPPWFAVVSGPTGRGRYERQWSGSYNSRDEAISKLRRQIRKRKRSYERRQEMFDEDAAAVRAQAATDASAMCEPLLNVGISVDGGRDAVSDETHEEIVQQVTDAVGYIDERVESATVSGAAIHYNVVVYVQVSPAETWDSLDRKVQRLKEWGGGRSDVGDVGRDLSVTLGAGDPAVKARNEPGA